MKNLPKEKRDRLLLIAIGTVICVAALWYVVIQSQKKTRDRIAKEILDQKKAIIHENSEAPSPVQNLVLSRLCRQKPMWRLSSKRQAHRPATS